MGAAGVRGRSTQTQGNMAVGTHPGRHMRPDLGLAAASAKALLSPASALEALEVSQVGELNHIPHLVVRLVTHGEKELVAEANLLLKQR